MPDKPTSDPFVVIEEQRGGYVRYRNGNGRRWEVRGTCDRRGDCLIGAVITNENGEKETIRDKAHITDLQRRLGRQRIDSEMDVPVTPEFKVCCGADRFTYTVLSEGS